MRRIFLDDLFVSRDLVKQDRSYTTGGLHREPTNRIIKPVNVSEEYFGFQLKCVKKILGSHAGKRMVCATAEQAQTAKQFLFISLFILLHSRSLKLRSHFGLQTP
jgi:hypothetical protein